MIRIRLVNKENERIKEIELDEFDTYTIISYGKVYYKLSTRYRSLGNETIIFKEIPLFVIKD